MSVVTSYQVMEQVVASRLQGVLYRDEMDYLDSFQSGFRQGFGPKTAMVTLMDDLHQGLARGRASLQALSAAFDTSDHGILLGQLAELGIGGTTLWWFCFLLADKSQMLILEDTCLAP